MYRPFEFVIPGTTDAADEMVRHIRHRQPLRQSERQWLDIEVTGWPAGRAFDLKEFAVPGEIAESYGAIWWWRSAPALGLVPSLQLDEIGQPDDQPGDFLRLIVGQPLVRKATASRLPVDMGQRQAIGIDHTIAARDRLKSPWSREAALRHASRISCAAVGGPLGMRQQLPKF